MEEWGVPEFAVSHTASFFVHQQKLKGELNWVLEHHRVRQQALETRV